DESLRPSGERQGETLADTAGLGRLTPELRAEVDQVVAQGQAAARISGKVAPDRLVSALVRCADFEGQRYCLGSGWTEDTQAQVQARMTTAARAIAARPAPVESTGDLDVLATLRREAVLSPAERTAEERTELTMAARSVAKVWLIRHDIEGVPLPEGFLDRHPEARATGSDGSAAARASAASSASPTRSPTRTPTTTPAATSTPGHTAGIKTQADYPRRAVVLDRKQVAEQRTTYWCGPTTMQMIAWGWKGVARGQAFWANRLGTTSSGTAISEMVRVVNSSTGWDRRNRAGPYIVLDISNYGFNKWIKLIMRHIHDYRAPIVFHPVLLKRFYPYLDDDASGHFQAGRGYSKRGAGPTAVSYFEPWNQQRFDPSEPYISRVQWRNAYKSYRANEAHFQHNIGV
ncbi:MAG: hypothetical protein JWO11_616, partial [Nocardioides sp.]|nr:hypothetical protein [Nocardioides sp.]